MKKKGDVPHLDKLVSESTDAARRMTSARAKRLTQDRSESVTLEMSRMAARTDFLVAPGKSSRFHGSEDEESEFYDDGFDAEEESRLGLREAIAGIKADLAAAVAAGLDDEMQLQLGKVEIELTGEFKEEVGGEGGVKFWVFSAGIKGGTAATRGHRIKVELSPPPGSDVVVGDEEL